MVLSVFPPCSNCRAKLSWQLALFAISATNHSPLPPSIRNHATLVVEFRGRRAANAVVSFRFLSLSQGLRVADGRVSEPPWTPAKALWELVIF